MKRLIMYLKDYKKESILAPLFKLLEAFFELMVPLVMANIIDYGISNRNMGYIGKMGLLLLLLGVVGLPRRQWVFLPSCVRHCLIILRI